MITTISGVAEIGPFPTLPIGHLFKRLKAPVHADPLGRNWHSHAPSPHFGGSSASKTEASAKRLLQIKQDGYT